MKRIKFTVSLMVLILGIETMCAQTNGDIDFDYLKHVAQGTDGLNQEAYEKPCKIYDDEQWYTAFNEKSGVEGDPQLANTLLRTCQEQLRDKLAGKVQQISTAYFDQMDIDGNSKAAEHIEGATQIVVEQMVAETQEYCRRERPAIYEKGKIILYMSIRVRKQELVKGLVKGIKNDAEAKTRFNESKFREAAFKVFEEDKVE